ncbi:MAG: endopeptidase La [Candidatus Cloacimonetes bacterium]|nr:endopeptidase La [Candidatus Cloacimonadota bacterium]
MEQNNRIPRSLPVIHLNNTVMFPYLMIPLVVSEESLKKVIDYALSNDKLLGFFLTREIEDKRDEVEIYEYGSAVSILRMLRNQDGSISLLLQGVSRIRIDRITQKEPFMMVEVETIPEILEESPKITALRNIATELVEKIISESSDLNKEIILGLKNIKQAGRVADIIAGNIPLEVKQKQAVLEAVDLVRRYERLNKYLAELIKQMRLENTIRSNIQLEMDEDQRRYYLKEQLAAIKKELGETDEANMEIENWTTKIATADLPDYVEKEAFEELDRLAMMSPASAEYNVIRSYLEWLVNLPWRKQTKDRLNLQKIEEILETDHYGLPKIKERIIEYIAVKKLNKKLKGPILCFVGPPGVGKTSFGKSIARALKRRFIRLSLGGIHDEAEIRGHRRTYIGAMPGKILNEIKRAGTANPLFMLDEIDKIGRDFRGDPASALLEVLDPEQNNEFIDNYINLKFDLSEVIFITTANILDTIPPALRDRMEILEFSSYVEEEKIHIARKYLVPKEAQNNGLTGKNVRFQDSALKEIIRYYVREAGVRNLQRMIASIMRKIARKIATGNTKLHIITDKNVKEFLGRRKFSMELANKKPEIGVVTGLAWTPYGGEILFCEATAMPGKGELSLTGLLGEVMKESAKLAFSYIKSNYQTFGIDIDRFKKSDFHIHLPAGAIPKDGPSAGVTLTTAIVSLVTGKKVKPNIAMTGELTLKGKILAIGGVKEKILAAKRAGIKNVILPEENRDTYEDLDDEIRQDMQIHFVREYPEILDLVILNK